MTKLFFIIVTGSKHYVLYQCFGIKNRKHVHNLLRCSYDRILAKREFKKLIKVLHGNDDFSIEFKG